MRAASWLVSRRLLDGLLLLLLVAVAFLLGCYEMGDSDIWWHLRGGQWILEHRRVPHLDPFTFGSADREWIDIHWSYEVLLALAYRAGGVGALVLLGATAGALAFLAVLTARRRQWPVSVIVLCWLPALILLSFRLDPRPEIFSLLYLGCYLAVLWRVEERPALAWLLPVIQVLWGNVQGLFILGPILVGLFVVAHLAQLLWRRWQGEQTWTALEKRWWRHLGGATLGVVLACLINPYFLKGVWFPFELFPKVADPNNPYKKYVEELQSPADFVSRSTRRTAGANWIFLAFYFLLPLLALSFVFPAAWHAWRAPHRGSRKVPSIPESAASTGSWLGGLAASVALLLLHTLTLGGTGPVWLNVLGENAPVALLMGGLVAAFVLRKRNRLGAFVLAVGGAAVAVYMAWLDATVLGGERGGLAGSIPPTQRTALLLIAAASAGVLVLRWGGNPYRMLLAAAFSYLALQALQNWSRFALVVGAVLTWNFAEWAEQLTAGEAASRPRIAAGWALRGGLVFGLILWAATLMGDRYYLHTGVPRHFAFREEPLAFAHDAARFAGQPGLPDRALVYGLGQTGVYVFHNAPGAKPFMDGRLEMPDLQTFKTYAAIEESLQGQDPHWEKAVDDLGNPLMLLEHQGNEAGEASLLIHPRWRCIYFDALASVFVPRDRGDSVADFPSVDFAGRRFQQAGRPSVPADKGAAAREERALVSLAGAVPRRSPENTWRWRIPILLAALDRADSVLAEEPTRPDAWVLLGNAYWNLNPHLNVKPANPADGWNLESSIWCCQATYCYRKAVEYHADNLSAWRSLAQAYRARGMLDSQLRADEKCLQLDPRAKPEQREQVEKLRQRLASFSLRSAPPPEQLPALLAQLSRGHRLELALPALETTGARSWNWPVADQVARLYMHLGRPADARRVWEQASGCPSTALRLARVASTFWIERDFEAAVRHYREARESAPDMAEIAWALAMLHTQRGDAASAREACRQGLRLALNARQREDLEALHQLLRPHTSHP